MLAIQRKSNQISIYNIILLLNGNIIQQRLFNDKYKKIKFKLQIKKKVNCSAEEEDDDDNDNNNIDINNNNKYNNNNNSLKKKKKK